MGLRPEKFKINYFLITQVKTDYISFLKVLPSKSDTNLVETYDSSQKFKSAAKKAQIAWIVSHCHTTSNREGYVKRLQDISALDCSTPHFNPLLFNSILFNPRLFYHELFSHSIFNLPGLKFIGLKNSWVEMF